MSFAAVQKHVAVMERAGLVTKERRGRERLVRTDAEVVEPRAAGPRQARDDLARPGRPDVGPARPGHRAKVGTHDERNGLSIPSVDTDYDRLTVTMIADFDASIEQVWELWADPRKLERWWGPPGLSGDVREARPGAGRRGQVLHDRSGGRPVRGRVARHGGRSAAPRLSSPTSAPMRTGRRSRTCRPAGSASSFTERDSGTRMEMRSKFESREDLEKWLEHGARARD